MNSLRQWVRNGGMAAFALVTAAIPVAAQQDVGEPLDERESYAFVRTVQGEATVAPQGNGFGDRLEQNQPLLTGDRIRTDGGSRLEILLPDRNRLTVDRTTTVRLDRLAFSGDRESRVTVLALEEGEILLQVNEEALGDELPRVEADAATVYVQEPGEYRIRADRDGWLEVVARSGYVELVTGRGSTLVRAGESAMTSNDRGGRIQIGDADAGDALERWSGDLDRAARRTGGSSRYLDGRVSYASGDLDDNGSWIVYENTHYWRPRVAVGWSPYWNGRWAWTPSGYTWVSYEPWGWVPYHYGTWCLVRGYGWAWRPGSVYSPAWVYWHWSNGYAGWCPTGYYTGYYDPWYRGGFRWGHYGWAGGSWGYYSNWNFAPVHCFRDRNFRGQYRRGDELRRERGWNEVPRGLITTDTRDFRPDRIDRSGDFLHRIQDQDKGRFRSDLPDVTDFVGRQRDLAPPIARAIAPDSPKEPRIRFDQPRVAEVPGWRSENRHGSDGSKGSPRLESGRREAPSPQVGSRGREGSGDDAFRGRAPIDVDKGAGARIQRQPATPRSGERETTVKPEAPRLSTGDNRQGWKDRTGTAAGSDGRSERVAPAPRSGERVGSPSSPKPSAPVERVIGGTRRPAPQADDGRKGSSGSTRSTPAPRAWEPSGGGKGDSGAGSDSAPRTRSGNDGRSQVVTPSPGYRTYEPRGNSTPTPSNSTPGTRSPRPAPSSPTYSAPRSPSSAKPSAPSTSPAPSRGRTVAPPPSSGSSRSGSSASSGNHGGGSSRSSSGSSKSSSGGSRSGSNSGSSKSSGGGDKDHR